MAGYTVKSRFYDAPRGAYVNPGAAWSPADADQAARLQKAGCIAPAAAKAPAAPKAPSARKAPAADPREAALREKAEALSVKQLREYLEAADIEPPENAKKAELVDLVVADAVKQAAADAASAGDPPAGG